MLIYDCMFIIYKIFFLKSEVTFLWWKDIIREIKNIMGGNREKLDTWN